MECNPIVRQREIKKNYRRNQQERFRFKWSADMIHMTL